MVASLLSIRSASRYWSQDPSNQPPRLEVTVLEWRSVYTMSFTRALVCPLGLGSQQKL